MDAADMFDPSNSDYGQQGSATWNREVFARAYCHGGPMDGVIRKLQSGFSVLVYVSGNCVTAAADYTTSELSSETWAEYGQRPEGATSLVEVWQMSGGVFGKITERFKSSKGTGPHAIYHNLDLLVDGYGRVHGHEAALTFLFALHEAVRSGVVLGLADRDAGTLPGMIERAFSDIVVLKDIRFDNFKRLIPSTLLDCLAEAEGDEFPEDAAWRLHRRLRWCDPIRAVKIMSAARAHHELREVLSDIRERTRPVGFETPVEPARDNHGKIAFPRGYDREVTLEVLRDQIIDAYSAWAYRSEFRSVESRGRALRSLHTGVILYGPPGTGKTRLARWIGGCTEFPVKLVSASEIRRPAFGEAERMVRAVFSDSRRAAPCVLVFDDADDLLPDRRIIQGSTASADLGIVNMMLQELEGFRGLPEGVLVILTTNRFKDLDPAISQRLSLHVNVPYPLDKHQVEEIVEETADTYGMELEDNIKEDLVQLFMRCPRGSKLKQAPMDRKAREECEDGLYSARSIARSMLHLRGGARAGGNHGAYCPTSEDVLRLKARCEGD